MSTGGLLCVGNSQPGASPLWRRSGRYRRPRSGATIRGRPPARSRAAVAAAC